MVKTEINQLLNKKMDRKDFIKHVGIAVVAAVGLSTVLKALGAVSTSGSSVSSSDGYGGSAYGGNK